MRVSIAGAGGADASAATSGHGGEENDPAVVLGGASNCGPHLIALHLTTSWSFSQDARTFGERINRFDILGLEYRPEVLAPVKV